MRLLSVHAAQARILRLVRPVPTEHVPLNRCEARVLAADVRGDDLPAFDNSSVDGFAVIAADLAGVRKGRPCRLRVAADIPAGSQSTKALRRGQAARIMTGAPIPPAADSVVMVENTDVQSRQADTVPPDWVTIYARARTGENIRRRGMDVRRGQRILRAGQRLRAQDLGMLAMLGCVEVTCFRRPRVALLSSGDELIPAGRPLRRGKVRDSNSYTLNSLIVQAGCDVLPLGIASDRKSDIQRRLEQAVHASVDVVVSSAGVSVGALDLVRDVIESGGQLDFWRVNVRPGKPLAVGNYRRLPFIGLPGNPVSAFIGFELFVEPALARLSGRALSGRRKLAAHLDEAIESDGRESYLRAKVEVRGGELHAKLTGHQGSGNLLSLVQANALLIIPAGVKSLPVGALAGVWLL